VFWSFLDIGTRTRDIDRPGLCCLPIVAMHVRLRSTCLRPAATDGTERVRALCAPELQPLVQDLRDLVFTNYDR
jgi:hypothetical protein